jgi:phospho-N-acetylmuramoyl-pentapeptide-transferase
MMVAAMVSTSLSIQSIMIVIVVCGLTVLLGMIGIPVLRRLRVGQTVRDDGPRSHFSKSGTPTFGGFFFLIPLFFLGLVSFLSDEIPDQTGILILLMLAFGGVGFLDDWIKVRISKKGLSVKQKTILLLLISIAFSYYYLYASPDAAVFRMPLNGPVWEITGWLRIPYAVFIILVLFFTSNSVNLTDGVDGLAASVTVISCLSLGIAGLAILPQTDAVTGSALVAFSISGGCLGFLIFNHHPARVFMGDTGSQALGAGFTGIALFYGVPWLILLVGVIYVAESLSVIIQVIYFKRTGGRRIFRMSPIHHHYELGGWSENRIVSVFCLVTLIGSVIGLLML